MGYFHATLWWEVSLLQESSVWFSIFTLSYIIHSRSLGSYSQSVLSPLIYLLHLSWLTDLREPLVPYTQLLTEAAVGALSAGFWPHLHLTTNFGFYAPNSVNYLYSTCTRHLLVGSTMHRWKCEKASVAKKKKKKGKHGLRGERRGCRGQSGRWSYKTIG